MDVDKLQRLAGAVRTGGKGSMRRKKKAVHKSVSNDDKRLQSVIKKMGMNAIPGIQEVNIFHTDTVTHFVSPKVQAAVHANAYVVSGHSETKHLEDILPNIVSQLGPENLANLKKMADQYKAE
ncbi:NAC domain-domain-containing protein [Ostreococcus tauri]|uniref:Nascent polypeptide-associated complex subunit beta n=1 Tax=Ostreococcus tauri TaxID=70448 RepID=A0A1Y5HXR7_OSTTA|nr:NAC domain-domain-containing protein [Ostreococcus tauri]